MSALTELINQVEDKNLRERLQLEVNRLTKQKKFGLVFEEHMDWYHTSRNTTILLFKMAVQ